jgi:hypothetical protein
MSFFRTIVVLLTLGLAHSALGGSPHLAISLTHADAKERATQSQLERLLSQYDLTPWIFTTSVRIDEDAIPHSHPILTLHTRHLKDDDLLLSTFVHEQAHWFFDQHKSEAEKAVSELRKLYPSIPVGFPEGSNDADGNYEHLIVIYLEYEADRILLGELRAAQVMAFWSQDHYTWLYRNVLRDRARLRELVQKYHLDPTREEMKEAKVQLHYRMRDFETQLG